MKRILALIVCILVICALPLFVFAEESDLDIDADIVPSASTVAVTEADTPETEPIPIKEKIKTTSDKFVTWAKTQYEEFSVIFTLLITALVTVAKNKKLKKSITTLNNNAVAVAENSEKAINDAFALFKQELEQMSEERQSIEDKFDKAMHYINSSKLANKALADELAQLLVLANIPNSKKDELYKIHLDAVAAISEAEAEVIADDGQKA